MIEPSKITWCSLGDLGPIKHGRQQFNVELWRVDGLMEFLNGIAHGQKLLAGTIESAKELTAFCASYDLYHFMVRPFGLHGAMATLQRQEADGQCPERQRRFWCSRYLQHDFWRTPLLNYGHRTNNPANCNRKNVFYLGFVLACGKIHPQMQDVRGSPIPTTKKRLRSFQLVWKS